jgi:hypothetical protein
MSSKIPVVANMQQMGPFRWGGHFPSRQLENRRGEMQFPLDPYVQSFCFGYYLFSTKKGLLHIMKNM